MPVATAYYRKELTDLVAGFPLAVQAYFSEALGDTAPLSLRTLHGYAHDFHVFWHYFLQPKGIHDLKDITPEHFRDFMAFLRLGYTAPAKNGKSRLLRVNSEPGLARKKSALRTIFFYLTKVQRLYGHDPTEALEERRTRRRGGKVHERLPVFLTPGETVRLQELAAHGKARYQAYQWLNLRDFTIISLFIATGVRVSELIALSEYSLDSDLSLMRVVGKGDKPRTVPLSAEVAAVLRVYLEHRRTLDGVAKEHAHILFLNRQHRPLTAKGVHDIVRQYCDAAGLYPNGKHVSPHKLRHTAATNWYRRGLDLYMLQQVLGHANPQTTEIYTHVSPREIIAAVRRADAEPSE